ncbi:hypothetical protein BDW22DRAFT_1153589 [Trametopsis cervina]|nr:hypothetical protein BDW22DRAFT_1153589 [Trametopsis cervina]
MSHVLLLAAWPVLSSVRLSAACHRLTIHHTIPLAAALTLVEIEEYVTAPNTHMHYSTGGATLHHHNTGLRRHYTTLAADMDMRLDRTPVLNVPPSLPRGADTVRPPDCASSLPTAKNMFGPACLHACFPARRHISHAPHLTRQGRAPPLASSSRGSGDIDSITQIDLFPRRALCIASNAYRMQKALCASPSPFPSRAYTLCRGPAEWMVQDE